MAANFQFVDNASIGRGTRKLIRSHVMKGKNAGRVIQRGAKGSPAESEAMGRDLSIYRPGSLGLPIQLSARQRTLIMEFFNIISDALHPPEFCFHYDARKSIWFQYMLSEEAFFHCTLAISAVHLSISMGHGKESAEAFAHIAHALRIINEKLRKDDATSDPNLAVVVSMMIHEQLRNDTESRRHHMNGLYQMVELRGGLAKLDHNTPLASKICRADIEYALHDGPGVKLFRDEMPRDHLRERLSDYEVAEVVRIPPAFADLDASLQTIALDMVSMATVLVAIPPKPKLDPELFQEALISFAYRLITFGSLGSSNWAKNDLCCLSMLAFVTRLHLRLGHEDPIRYDRLAERLRFVLKRFQATSESDTTALFWALVMSGITVFSADPQPWLMDKIVVTANELSIVDWTGAHAILRQFPWISLLNEKFAKELWERSTGYSS